MAPPKVDSEYRQQIQNARQELDRLISLNKKRYAPLMLHLALHDAGIYGFITGTQDYLIKRGPNGSIKNERELSHRLNKGLQEAVERCEEVKKKNDKITYADLFQLAGVVAVQKTGGPTIEFVPGREDSTEYPAEEGRLKSKELDEPTLENIRKRMGLEEKDMVALFGLHDQWSLPDGSQAANELEFDNSYLKKLQEKKDENNLLFKVERFREWVKTYAEEYNTFLKDYAAAHKKVSELGMSVVASPEQGLGMSVVASPEQGGGKQTDQKTSAPSASSWNRVRLVQGIGIAVVTTAIIVGFFFSRRSKLS